MSDTDRSPTLDASTPGRDMTSEVYELISGDGVSFFVHKDILTAQSYPFRQATTGPWQEATERKILLTDWDTDTVARLVEFLYSNDYPYPDPTLLEPGPAPQLADVRPADPSSPPPHKQRPLTPFEDCLQKLLPPNRPGKVPDVQRLGPCDPAQFDYEKVLLAHARVYVLAHYKGVKYLQALALKRLLLVLSRLQPLQTDSHIARNIAEFAGYVYANTTCLSSSEEPLRKITSHFIALNVVVFQNEERAVKVMAEERDLATDILAKLCRRITDPKDCLAGGDPPRKRYISNVEVVAGSTWREYPYRVRASNSSGNINAGSERWQSIGLLSRYTDISNDACTGFESSMKAAFGGNNDVDKLRSRLELRGIKDETNCLKITDVFLIRRRKFEGLDFAVMKQYDGMTDNISYTDRAVYLVWKTVNTGKD